MKYVISPIDSICANCNRKIKKTVFIDHLPYGSECAKGILGLTDDYFEAPLWLYKLAQEFVRNEFNLRSPYSWLSDVQVNFFNEHATSGKVWEKPVVIEGKRVKVAWQIEIGRYIAFEYAEISGRNISEFSDGEYYTK